MGRLVAGAATANITPPLGVYISGYYHARQASAVHDELWARALCLSDGVRTIALISVDLIGMPEPMIRAAKERIAALTGGALRPDQVLIGCTHTHTAPETGSEPMFPVHAAYLQVATEKIADAAVMAYRALAPAEAAYGTGHLEGVSFNRRFWMKDGSLVTNPGIGNPDIVRAAGPTDPEVDVLSVRSARGAPLAGQESTLCIMVGFAVHLDTTGGDQISADYPYYLTETLKRACDPRLVVLFHPGAMGDLNHIDVQESTLCIKAADAPIKGQSHPSKIGKALADEVLKTLVGAVYSDDVSVDFAVTPVELPVRRVTAEAVAEADRIIERIDIGKSDFTLEVVAAWRDRGLAGMGRSLTTNVQAFRVGDLAIAGLPGEVFVELGLALKSASPFRPTFVVELANASIGYVPTFRAYSEGGYEVTSTALAPGAGEKLVDAALGLLRGLAKP